MAEAQAKRARPAALEARVSTLALPAIGKINALAIGIDGTVFVATDSAIYVLSPAGFVALFAGSRSETRETGYQDGEGPDARFDSPRGLAVASDGSLLVADTKNHRLRRVTPHGTVSTVAGGERGFADGVGTAVCFYYPWGIVVDGHGTIYVSDYGNECIRKVTPSDWTVSTLCCVGTHAGFADEAAAATRFHSPLGLAMDMDGNLIVADRDNHCICKVVPLDGRVSTVAGSGSAGEGLADGEAAAARFDQPHDVAVDGNNTILVADCNNNCLCKIASEGAQVTTLAGSSEPGKVDSEGASVRFNAPCAVVLDERGRLFVIELANERCLRVVEASLAPRLAVEPWKNPLTTVLEDYAKLLTDTALADVTFAVDGQRFPAHRCVLAVRSPYFKALFTSGQGMREEGSRVAGGEILLQEVSAPDFEMLMEYLYAHKLPEGEEWQAGAGPGEMAVVADRFQASGLYVHCVRKFRSGLKVANVVVRLVQAHDSGLVELEEVAMSYLVQHALAFKVCFKSLCHVCLRACFVLGCSKQCVQVCACMFCAQKRM